MRLAIMLASGPETDNARTASLLARAALERGHDVALFFDDQGVRASAQLAELGPLGVRLAACAYSARNLGVPPVPGVRWGGQLDWAEAVRDADRALILA